MILNLGDGSRTLADTELCKYLIVICKTIAEKHCIDYQDGGRFLLHSANGHAVLSKWLCDYYSLVATPWIWQDDQGMFGMGIEIEENLELTMFLMNAKSYAEQLS